MEMADFFLRGEEAVVVLIRSDLTELETEHVNTISLETSLFCKPVDIIFTAIHTTCSFNRSMEVSFSTP